MGIENLNSKMGRTFYGVVCESVIDRGKKPGTVRIIPVEGEILPRSLFVQCSRFYREHYPLGTRFKIDVQILKGCDGGFYLCSKKRDILYTEEEYNDKFANKNKQFHSQRNRYAI